MTRSSANGLLFRKYLQVIAKNMKASAYHLAKMVIFEEVLPLPEHIDGGGCSRKQLSNKIVSARFISRLN